ncbi:MAG TPA: extracellular solute-binding protein [Acidimicrobiales bacterium]|nr:extracellular solute-binding protein [Acidimicrobiales bacterium]
MESGPISRRQFLTGATAGAAVLLSGTRGLSSALHGNLARLGGSQASGGTAQVWVASEAENPAIQTAINTFNKTSDVKLELVIVPATTSMNTKVRVAIKTSKRPNMFFNWAGGSIQPYVQDGLLVDLTSSLDAKPSVKNSFLPSVLGAAEINNQFYGIPVKGIQPVVFFYNKTMFKDYKVSPPSTWDELLSAIKVFNSNNITPILLPGATNWCTLMYLEYISARLGPYNVFEDLLSNNPKSWENPVILKTLQYCVDLVNANAFGSTFKTLNYSDGVADALFAKGKGAMMLMGTWDYGTQVTTYHDFAVNDIGWMTFPTIPGGTGNPAAVAGNPSNWLSVVKTTPDVDQACVDFLMTQMNSSTFVHNLIAVGDVPAIEGIEDELKKAPNAAFAIGTYNLVKNAPSFELSWDQAVSQSYGPELDTAIQQVFFKQISPQQFVDKMMKYASEAS